MDKNYWIEIAENKRKLFRDGWFRSSTWIRHYEKYSHSALSFMLDGLKKPVIFTGSQIPIGSRRTDARKSYHFY